MTVSKEQPVFRITIPFGAYPEFHEITTAQVLLQRGDVEFLIASRTRGARTPDITWNGADWEMKSPTGNGKRVLDDAIKGALKQSRDIVIDLRRTKLDDTKTIAKLKKSRDMLRGVRHLIIIDKEEEIVDIK